MITDEMVITAENELLAAQRNHDIAVLDKLLHDGLLFLAPNGEVYTKQMDLDAHRSGTMVIEKLEPCTRTIQLHDSIAVVILEVDTKGAIAEQPVEGIFRYIRVWKLTNGQPKIVAGSFCKCVDTLNKILHNFSS
jgi:hypothetical protein